MTAVQKANLIDDWAKVLTTLPYPHVEKAFVDWLEDSESLDEKGRMVKPGIARIRQMAIANADAAEIRSRPRLPAPWVKPQYDAGDLSPAHRKEICLWWTAWKQIGSFPSPGESLDAFKDRIRVKANELDPNAGWRIPGEPLR